MKSEDGPKSILLVIFFKTWEVTCLDADILYIGSKVDKMNVTVAHRTLTIHSPVSRY